MRMPAPIPPLIPTVIKGEIVSARGLPSSLWRRPVYKKACTTGLAPLFSCYECRALPFPLRYHFLLLQLPLYWYIAISYDLTFFITEYKLVDINKFSISFLSGIEQTETSRNYRFDNREFESRSPWTMQHRGHCELYEPAVTGVWITEDTRVVAPVVEDVLPLVRNLIFNFTGKSSFEIAR